MYHEDKITHPQIVPVTRQSPQINIKIIQFPYQKLLLLKSPEGPSLFVLSRQCNPATTCEATASVFILKPFHRNVSKCLNKHVMPIILGVQLKFLIER